MSRFLRLAFMKSIDLPLATQLSLVLPEEAPLLVKLLISLITWQRHLSQHPTNWYTILAGPGTPERIHLSRSWHQPCS